MVKVVITLVSKDCGTRMKTSALRVSYRTVRALEVCALDLALIVWTVASYYLPTWRSLPSLSKDRLFTLVPQGDQELLVIQQSELIDHISPLESRSE